MEREWLRWCDRHGQVIPTAAELFAQERVRSERALEQVETERLRAEEERLRAEEASRRAEEEWLRAERLAERLRQLGLSDVD
jgi:hypothetical protein